MKAPKGFTIVPIEYRKTHKYPTDCKVMWFCCDGWIDSKSDLWWDCESFDWAIESNVVIKPTKDYSETVLRRIEKECRNIKETWRGDGQLSMDYILNWCKEIRSDIKKIKGE